MTYFHLTGREIISLRLLTLSQMALKSASRFASYLGETEAIVAASVTLHPVSSREKIQWVLSFPALMSQTQFNTCMDNALGRGQFQ